MGNQKAEAQVIIFGSWFVILNNCFLHRNYSNCVIVECADGKATKSFTYKVVFKLN